MTPRFDPDPWARRPQSPRPLSRYNVVLHRFSDKSLLFVIGAVMELTRFCREEATNRMWEAYHLGKSVVVATHLERAELYVEQFAERGLPASVEPAGA
jgi:ATP-dependent Clp protease adapter protein ClpS